MRSEPLAVKTPAQAAADYARVVKPEPCEAAPFYLVSFKNSILREVQQYYSNAANYPDVPDAPSMQCLVHKEGDPESLQVLSTMSDSPPSTARGSIWVRTPGVTFEKSAMGNRGTLEADKSHQEYVKIFKGQLVVMADQKHGDVAVMLLDGLITYFEGTKRHWMERLGLTQFEVISLSDAQVLSTEPPVARATLTVAYQGRLNVTGFVVAPPLKRVVHKVEAGG